MKKNAFKKIIALLSLAFILIIFVIPIYHVFATEYIPLAPLPNFTSFDPGSSTTTGAGDLGKYLNIIIPLFIGICAVLAVIMIVVGGMQYMTSELISSKEEGRKRILNAIFGLLLALGAWLILFTINPSLLDTGLGSLSGVTIVNDLMPETETIANAVTSDGGAPSGATKGCPEGIGRTTGGISVCNSLVSKVNNMIIAAKNANPSCVLTGGGYRSPEAQKQLRIANCNGNYTDRNASCHPPTALPGASRHQQGLAIDFQSSGQLIQSTSNTCYLWLSANASTYGLHNLSGEPWHWSTDGN